MKYIERIFVHVAGDPWSAIVRVAIGFAIPPVFRVLWGGSTSIITSSILFLGVLIALRVVPAAMRHLLPFSVEAKEIWRARRNLSKRYDSFAWQQLFWMGLGLALYAAVGGGLMRGELVVMLFCLIAGGAGLLAWYRTGVPRAIPLGIR